MFHNLKLLIIFKEQNNLAMVISYIVRRSIEANLFALAFVFAFPLLAKQKKKVEVFAKIIYDCSFVIELRASKKVSGTNHLPKNEAFQLPRYCHSQLQVKIITLLLRQIFLLFHHSNYIY